LSKSKVKAVKAANAVKSKRNKRKHFYIIGWCQRPENPPVVILKESRSKVQRNPTNLKSHLSLLI
jgi:hypothetical protein